MIVNKRYKLVALHKCKYVYIHSLSECILSCFQGIVPAGKSVEITVSYMPGIPEEFARSFEVN